MMKVRLALDPLQGALVSTSASVVAKDGFVNQTALAALSKKIEKAASDFTHEPKVKPAKTSTQLVYTVPGLGLKEGRVVAKAITAIEGIASAKPTVTAKKRKTGPDLKTLVITVVVNGVGKAASAIIKQVTSLVSSSLKPQPEKYYVVSAKSKVVDFDASKQAGKKGQSTTYLARRAVKIALRSKLSATVRLLLPVYAKGVLPAAVEKEMMVAESAIKQHIKSIAAQQKIISGIQDAQKASREAALDSAAKWFTDTLGEKAVVKAQGVMGGSTVIVKLGDTYVSLSPSDASAFAKAKRA
jgi:hypothetical protein